MPAFGAVLAVCDWWAGGSRVAGNRRSPVGCLPCHYHPPSSPFTPGFTWLFPVPVQVSAAERRDLQIRCENDDVSRLYAGRSDFFSLRSSEFRVGGLSSNGTSWLVRSFLVLLRTISDLIIASPAAALSVGRMFPGWTAAENRRRLESIFPEWNWNKEV